MPLTRISSVIINVIAVAAVVASQQVKPPVKSSAKATHLSHRLAHLPRASYLCVTSPSTFPSSTMFADAVEGLMLARKQEVAKTVLHLRESKDQLIRQAAIFLPPKLAVQNRPSTIPSSVVFGVAAGEFKLAR